MTIRVRPFLRDSRDRRDDEINRIKKQPNHIDYIHHYLMLPSFSPVHVIDNTLYARDKHYRPITITFISVQSFDISSYKGFFSLCVSLYAKKVHFREGVPHFFHLNALCIWLNVSWHMAMWMRRKCNANTCK